ncbi:MAG: hypothetical protein O2820_16830 [Planctomycetota bacterium]|nr:hypothetical protein [Planctomycetota bacterium]MDA1250885.1 hypothetical protein [Planctomycetota bacterium]
MTNESRQAKNEVTPSVTGGVVLTAGSFLFLALLIYHGMDLAMHFDDVPVGPRALFCGLVFMELFFTCVFGYGAFWHFRGVKQSDDQ